MGKKKDEKLNLESFQSGIAEQYGVDLISLDKLAQNIVLSLEMPNMANLVVGLSGVGKTECIRDVCISQKIGCVTMLLSQCNEGDLQGLPFADRERGVCVRFPFQQLPTVERVKRGEIPEKGILFLDELNRASREVQNGAFQLLGEKRCGDAEIAPGWTVWSAVNPEGGDYMVNKIDPAMLNRMITYVVRVCSATWLDWAEKNDLNSCVIDFIATRPDLLYDIDSHGAGKVFATPRSWSRISQVTNTLIDLKKSLFKPDKDGNTTVSYRQLVKLTGDHHSMMAGLIGAFNLATYLNFMDDYTDQLSATEVLEKYLDPKSGLKKKVETAVQRGVVAMLNNTNDQLIGHIRINWPKIFINKKREFKSLSKPFLNLHEYWSDITVQSADKSLAFYQSLVESPKEQGKEAVKKHEVWSKDIEDAVQLMAQQAQKKGVKHFSADLIRASRMGLDQASTYADPNTKSN